MPTYKAFNFQNFYQIQDQKIHKSKPEKTNLV